MTKRPTGNSSAKAHKAVVGLVKGAIYGAGPPKVNVASVNIWEKTLRSLRTLRLDTMRGKFVAFAVLATLFTTLAMTVMLYGRNRRSLSDRVGQELRLLSSDVAREADAWFDQRVYDLRLRPSPYALPHTLAPPPGPNAAHSP